MRLQGLLISNNDNNPDLLLRDKATGALSVWFWNGTTPQATTVNTGSVLSAASYEIAGVADFNNDNNPDLLLRDKATGALWVWFWTATIHSTP